MKLDRTRLLDRTVHLRDARLVLIATEGRRTEPDYFHGLQEDGVLDRSRVKLVLLPPADGASAPTHVLDRLVAEETRLALKPMDERWLVLDTDRWPVEQLAAVTQQASQRRYGLAVSNPCFEAWLVLHFDDVLPTDPAGQTCDSLDRRWRAARAGVDRPFTAERVRDAVTRAEAGDLWPGDRWPQGPGTHVYRLVGRLLPAP